MACLNSLFYIYIVKA